MKKHLLFVSQKFPFPLTDGGNIRTFKILEALSKNFHVTLIASVSKGQNPEACKSSVAHLCEETICVPDVKSKSPVSALRVAIRALFKKLPVSIAYNHNPNIRFEVASRIASGKFTYIHLNHLDTAQYLDQGCGSAKVVLDSHNILFNFFSTMANQAGSRIWRTLLGVEAARMRAYEISEFRKVHSVLVCSDIERQCLEKEGLSEIRVIPNGVDTEFFHPPLKGYQTNPPNLVFTGAMGYFPNADAARFFITEVMPLLRPKVQGLNFLAVGKDPPEDLIALAKEYHDVVVTGSVADVRAYVWQSRVFVIPIRMGAGTRLKVLEAFAMGIPVVSTSLGAEGIGHTQGKNILIANDAVTLAKQIVTLLADPDQQQDLAGDALRLARKTYDWKVIGESLLSTYEA